VGGLDAGRQVREVMRKPALTATSKIGQQTGQEDPNPHCGDFGTAQQGFGAQEGDLPIKSDTAPPRNTVGAQGSTPYDTLLRHTFHFLFCVRQLVLSVQVGRWAWHTR
jgi:hypothetical protein